MMLPSSAIGWRRESIFSRPSHSESSSGPHASTSASAGLAMSLRAISSARFASTPAASVAFSMMSGQRLLCMYSSSVKSAAATMSVVAAVTRFSNLMRRYSSAVFAAASARRSPACSSDM